MDYCLTVRGTVGLEAACRGIPVLTGGTGRYDRKGFTIDSATPQQYLERIARLQESPGCRRRRSSWPSALPMASFCFGLCRCRACCGVRQEIQLGELSNPVEINLRNRKDWEEAPDLRAFVNWVTKSDNEDFLVRPDAGSIDNWEICANAIRENCVELELHEIGNNPW